MTTIKAPDCAPVVSNPGPLTANCAAATNVVTGGFTANGVVGGTIPADAKMQLRVGPDTLGGPWQASPQVPATAGNFSHAFTGLAGGNYAIRVDIVDSTGTTAILTSSPDCFVTVPGALSNCSAGTGTRSVATIGDSLTTGNSPGNGLQFYSYRGQLQTVLSATGIAYDMVGRDVSGSLGGGPDNTTSAYGGAGITTIPPSTGQTEHALKQINDLGGSVHTVIINIGTNEGTPAQYQTMFNAARAKWPTADIVLCTVPANSSLTSTIQSIAASDSRVRVADVASLGLTQAGGDLVDSVHYSQSGAAKVGNLVAAAVKDTSCFTSSTVVPPQSCTPPPLSLAQLIDDMLLTGQDNNDNFIPGYGYPAHRFGGSTNLGSNLKHGSGQADWYTSCGGSYGSSLASWILPWLITGLHGNPLTDYNAAIEVVRNPVLVRNRNTGAWSQAIAGSKVDLGGEFLGTDNQSTSGSLEVRSTACGGQKIRLTPGGLPHPYLGSIVDLSNLVAANPSNAANSTSVIDAMVGSVSVRLVPWNDALPIGNISAANKPMVVYGMDPYVGPGNKPGGCTGAMASGRIRTLTTNWLQIGAYNALDATAGNPNSGISVSSIQNNPPPGYT